MQALFTLTSIIRVKFLKMLKHSSEPPLLHNHSHFFFLGCAYKHPYQCIIQRDLVRLKRAMYPLRIHHMLQLDDGGSARCSQTRSLWIIYWYGSLYVQPRVEKWLWLHKRRGSSLCDVVAAVCTYTCWLKEEQTNEMHKLIFH